MSRARGAWILTVQTSRRWDWALVLAIAALGAGGCAVSQTARRDMAEALSRYEQRRVQDANDYAQISAAGSSPEPTSEAHDNQPLESSKSLRDYLLLALERNPEIKSAEEIARAKAARVPQVTALPDPMLMTKTLPEPVRTAEGDSSFVLGVQQRFPVPEKLDRAGRVALHEARMALETLQEVRLRVIADVKRAYFRLYVIDTTIEIDVANQDLLRGLIDAVRAQVAAGRRSQADVLRAQVELSTLESKIIELRQQRQSVTAQLNRLLNRPPAIDVRPPAKFAARGVDLRLDALFAAAEEYNPDLRHVRQQLERDREAIELARLAYWPDFTIGFEWMQMSGRDAFEPPPNPQTGMPAPVNRLSEDGSDNWAIIAGLNLPIWFGKIEGGIRAARRRLLASQHQYVATQNRVQFQIEDAYARVRAQQELSALFESTIIPQARQAYELSRAGYAVGKSNFLDVIENWRLWLAFTVQYHTALGELERSVADLEQALGLSLSEVP